MSHRIALLVVDDDPASRRTVQREFERRGHVVAVAGSAEEGLARVQAAPLDVLLLDLKQEGAAEIAFLDELRRRGHDGEVVILTATPDQKRAVAALRRGAFDVRCRPVDLETLETVVRHAAERRLLRAENRALKAALAETTAAGVVPLCDVERRHILAVYEHAGRNKRRASKLLGISLRTLYNKLTEYNVHGNGGVPTPAGPGSGAGKR